MIRNRKYTDNEVNDDNFFDDDLDDIEEIEISIDEESPPQSMALRRDGKESPPQNMVLKESPPRAKLFGGVFRRDGKESPPQNGVLRRDGNSYDRSEPSRREPVHSGSTNNNKIGILAILIVVLIVVLGVIIYRITPTKKETDIYNYYGIKKGEAKLIYNCEPVEGAVVKAGDRVYIGNTFLGEYISDRFFYDKENAHVIYTDANSVSTIPIDTNQTIINGLISESAFTIAIVKDDELYIDVEYICDRLPLVYKVLENPDRVILIDGGLEYDVVSFKDKAVVREDDRIKAPVMEKEVNNGEIDWVKKGTTKSWTEVHSTDGRRGFVKTKHIAGTKNVVYESKVVKEEYPNQLRDHKIELVWHGVYDEYDNARIRELLTDVKGLNVISPTWYKAIDEKGNISSLVDEEYIAYVKSLGLEIWPLISDFTSAGADSGWDEAYLLNNTEARRNLINNIMSEITRYGYEGFNIDFEKVPSDCKAGYTQFIRELSVRMREAGKVLSVDNYVPRSYNMQYNRKAQAECVDYVIVMGYDEHYAGGEEAGSVASIDFVTDGIDKTLEMVPKEKVLNALPFYTRMWMQDANGGKPESKAYGISDAWDRCRELGINEVWDDTVKQYVAEGIVGGTYYSIWLEDEKSMTARMDVIKNRGLAGIAAWSLGFETPEMWDIINLQ